MAEKKKAKKGKAVMKRLTFKADVLDTLTAQINEDAAEEFELTVARDEKGNIKKNEDGSSPKPEEITAEELQGKFFDVLTTTISPRGAGRGFDVDELEYIVPMRRQLREAVRKLTDAEEDITVVLATEAFNLLTDDWEDDQKGKRWVTTRVAMFCAVEIKRHIFDEAEDLTAEDVEPKDAPPVEQAEEETPVAS